MKTVLAPNAPWPKPDQPLQPKPSKSVRIHIDSFGLDYFAEAREQIAKHRQRDSVTGRFASSKRVSG